MVMTIGYASNYKNEKTAKRYSYREKPFNTLTDSMIYIHYDDTHVYTFMSWSILYVKYTASVT